MMVEMDPAGTFASFMSQSTYESLPAEVVLQYKRCLLDTLAALVGGVYERPVTRMLAYFKGQGGKPEARVIGHGDRLPLLSAAFVNGVACRALDLGDVEIEASHLSEFIVPSLLSEADARGGVDGKTFLAAYAAAAEIVARIGHGCFAMSVGYHRPGEVSPRTPPIHQWGVICGTSRLRGFDSERTWDAIGHGYATLSATDAQATVEGSYMKCLQHGFTAMNGIVCCQLAEEGFRGTRNVFSGPRGFISVFYPTRNEASTLTAGLGSKWIARFEQKQYSSCYFNHACIQAAREIVAEGKILPEQIRAISCAVAESSPCIGPEKWDPKTPGEARFSLAYAVATAMTKDKLFIDDYTETELNRRDVRALMTKIKASPEARLAPHGGRVTVETADGRTLTRELLHPPGSRESPLTWDNVAEKFRLVMEALGSPIPQQQQMRIVDMVRNVEEIRDMRELIDLVVWPAQGKRGKSKPHVKG